MNSTRTWRGRVFVGASLDGYIARIDSDIDWLTNPPEGRRHARVVSDRHALEWDTFYPDVDHLVMGRGTYEKVLTFSDWPYCGRQVIILSSTVGTDDDRVTVARTVEQVQALLHERQAVSVYIDGGKTIQTFLTAGLVDEITIGFAPVLIGSGLRLFGYLDHDVHLTLRATHASSGGMVHVTYDVAQPH